jgi:CDP-paratose 2-epimerase
MGKVDQGFISLWCARHLFGGSLAYIGFGGQGQQVRDVLHVADLYALLRFQMETLHPGDFTLYNVGGGAGNAISLRELTALCEERSGRTLSIAARPETHQADIPWYVTDNTVVTDATGWRPSHDLPALVDDVFDWLRTHREALEPILGGS